MFNNFLPFPQTGELSPTVARLRPQLQGLLNAAIAVRNSSSIKAFFAYVLTLGNFINTVNKKNKKSYQL